MITNILIYNIQQSVATLEDSIFALKLYTLHTVHLCGHLGKMEGGGEG